MTKIDLELPSRHEKQTFPVMRLSIAWCYASIPITKIGT